MAASDEVAPDLEKQQVGDEELSPTIIEKRRVRYFDDDIQADPRVPADEIGYPLSRRNTNASTFSVHSVRSTMTTRNINPALALPITYRTVSFNISNSQEREIAEKKIAKKGASKELEDLDWHKITVSGVYKRLQSSQEQGLTDAEVKKRISEYGRNVPSPPPSQALSKIFGYFFGGFGSILLLGSILVFISWKPLGQPPSQANLALAIVLAVVFIIQAAFNAWQDFSSSRVMNSITGMLPEACFVLRDGVKQSIQAPDVVPGDIMYFKAGAKLPADIRFVEVSSDAKFDRSILTGESLPLGALTESTEENYLETKVIGMQGTHCTSGQGVGVVVSTGDNTVFGHIAKLTSQPSKGMTTLQKEILRFVLIIVSLMITMNIVVVAVWAGYIRKNHPNYMPVQTLIVDIVSVGIAFVPEGLPIALTASLTITANTMRQNKILCKSLKTVETLGAVSVLLSDKTGTLTKNLMVVTNCLIGYSNITASEASQKYAEDGEYDLKSSLTQLRIVAAVCNAGEFDVTTMPKPLADRKIIGDATDQAVLRFSESLSPVTSSRELWRKRFDLAFNSKNKFAICISSPETPQSTLVTLSEKEAALFDSENDMLLTIKGAPDVLLPRCTSYVAEDAQVHEIEDGVRSAIEAVKDSWSSEGKRVILLARKVLKSSEVRHNPNDGEFEAEVESLARNNLVLVGLLGIVDPPRDEVPEVVKTLRGAGIRVMMVTGDFKLTAQAIARACGIISTEKVHGISDLPRRSSDEKKPFTSWDADIKSIVISGPELITMNDVQWDRLCTAYAEVVFARTTPEQKLRIVKEYKARDNIVAMTGDGVNDAPSLKEADIGIAPGSGSDIAIEAADMVLLESFSAIVEAVLYGRVVFDNLKKTIAYLLPAGSFSEFWPVMTSVLFGLPQILSSFLMIIICCFTDCAAATVLAYEKPEADVMKRPPRNPKKDKLVDWKLLLQAYGFIGVIETVSSFSMSFWYVSRQGIPFSAVWFGFGSTPEGFTSDQLTAIFNKASAIYFVTLVVMQWFSLMAIRNRHLSIFQHPPAFKKSTQNLALFPAILFALCIVFVFCYIPGLQGVAGSSTIPVEHWFLPMSFGLGLLSLDEIRKAVARRWPKGLVARCAW